MSEYRYYGFLAMDRPLDEGEMAELRGISTRADITPTHFSNEYNYGDLKADPARLLERYFTTYATTMLGSRASSLGSTRPG